MFCKNCGTPLREGAKFCPECGITVEGSLPPLSDEYSYETLQKLFPWKAIIPIILLLWLPFTAIGLLVALAEGFWFVPAIMSSIVLFAIFIIAWGNKGKKKKWGVDRTMWIITTAGYGSGYPPDVAKRIGTIGAASAGMTAASGHNWSVTSQGINMAQNLKHINGLPIMPWTGFIKAEYRPQKREIALHMPNGQVGIIKTNPDNYAYVEQLVRGYIRSK